MLEIKIKNIVNNEFLKRYDFYDIPGLNEKIVEKEKPSSSEEGKNKLDNDEQKKKGKNIHKDIKNQEMKYINGLFPLLKKKIDFGIIIIDSSNYYYPSNINIIRNISSILQTNIKKYIFILNKIDKVEKPNETIKKCKAFFTNEIDSSLFRIEDNFFQPLNSNQFKNEMLMKSDFESFFLYYFNKYCEQVPNLNESISFLDFISYEITSEIPNQDDKNDAIETLAQKVKEEEYSKVKEIYQKTKNESNLKINYGIDFEDEDCENALKAFYSKFLDKSFAPTFSKNVQEILNFFNNFKFEAVKPIEKGTVKQTDNFLKNLKEQEKMIDNFQKVFHQLKKYINNNSNNDNIIDSLDNDLKELKMMISNQRKIFIPLIGVSSAGKSTILNDIVGYTMFPESSEECTTRGIIIQHSFDGTSKLFEVNIESSIQNNYYIFKENTNLAPIEGKDKIYSFFESINEEFSNKEEKSFFILKTPIRFLDDFKISEDLKRRISFIDLPGSNTLKNSFNDKKGEFTIYQKLLKICTSFVFVIRGTAININENDEIIAEANSIHKDSKIKNKVNFLKNCTFVINLFSKLKEEDKNIQKIKKNISTTLSWDKESNLNFINAAFFNAKQYKLYLMGESEYSNTSNVISSLKVNYRKQFNLLNGNLKKEKDFPKYCIKILKQNLENISLKYDSKFKCNDEFKSLILSEIIKVMKELNLPLKAKDNENIEKISNILKFIQINIKNITYYKESNCEDFFSQLVKQIKQSDSYMENEFYEYLDNTMEQFNSFFEIPPEKRNTHAQKEFSILEKKTRKDIEKLFSNISFSENFEKIKKDINNFLNEKILSTKQILKEHNNDIKKGYSAICNEIMNKNMKELSLALANKLEKLDEDFSKIKDDLYKNGKEINNKFEIDNSFLDDLDKIILIDSIKNHFGISNYFSIKNAELTDKIRSNFGFWGSIGHFFDVLFKKNKNLLKENIQDLQKRIEEIIKNNQRIFIRNFDDVKKEITSRITKVLLTQSTDLSKISQSDFNNAKELFNLTKEFLFKDGTAFIVSKYSFIFLQIFIRSYIWFLKFLVGLFFFEEII